MSLKLREIKAIEVLEPQAHVFKGKAIRIRDHGIVKAWVQNFRMWRNMDTSAEKLPRGSYSMTTINTIDHPPGSLPHTNQ